MVTNNPLSVEFLYELYACAMQEDMVCSTLVQHMKKEYLPDRTFQKVQQALCSHYKTYKNAPSYAVLGQLFNSDFEVLELINTFQENGYSANHEVVLDMLERYIKGVRLQETYSVIGKLYNQNKQQEAEKKLVEYAEWVSGFTLKASAFVDVTKTFSERFYKNREKDENLNRSRLAVVSRFYVDELDLLNAGRNLRGQLTCFLASTGVGKSHVAKHIGVHGCVDDGLRVLHFQLEGSENEALDAYSGGLVQKNSFYFEKAKISDAEMKEFERKLSKLTGSIIVRTYPRFGSRTSTLDLKSGISEYKKLNGISPDVVIVDSMDLLTDASRQNWGAEHERSKRIAVANDLKDLASDENIWIVATYQSTIEDQEWLNDERNVLTEYNCAEAKGLARPCTHLISLNQSSAERKEDTMRVHVAKSRFFKKGQTIRIATDFDHEVFYDARRSMSLNLKR